MKQIITPNLNANITVYKVYAIIDELLCDIKYVDQGGSTWNILHVTTKM